MIRVSIADTVRRVDSIQSKRQKGSLSDRSDTSELCPSAGEESPGIMESPDEQVPESPTDSNDVDDSSANMPWIKVRVHSLLLQYLQMVLELDATINSYFPYACP